ncbi:MFS domain-containing protein [Mycena sanguinolenta]|uniref:MFS domain-containing protein n=1 Tax=Mycena sanguinolenta TaxID=230812 RepID=A0A8H7D4R8_9AGAR|nr:MFS domain-containing protein [Mycena sanguinolenta]
MPHHVCGLYQTDERSGLAAGAFCVQFGMQGTWGVIPIHLAEMAPPAFRATFPGVVYQLGNMVSSASAQIESGVRFLPLGPDAPLDAEPGGDHLKTTVKSEVVPDYAKVQGILIGVMAAFVLFITIIGPEVGSGSGSAGGVEAKVKKRVKERVTRGVGRRQTRRIPLLRLLFFCAFFHVEKCGPHVLLRRRLPFLSTFFLCFSPPFINAHTLITTSLPRNHGSHFEKHRAAFDEGGGGDDAYIDQDSEKQDSEKGTEERPSTEKPHPVLLRSSFIRPWM